MCLKVKHLLGIWSNQNLFLYFYDFQFAEMMRRLFISCFLLIFMLPMGLRATHIVGGELYYIDLGNNTYEIRLTVYRDCWNGIPDFDDPAAVGIFDSANQFVDSIMMKFRGRIPIPPIINDPCIIPPANICYEVTTYIDTITLPPIPGGYQLSYQRCCRNYTILNIFRPDTTGATYYATIPSPDVVKTNSNPRFNNLPPPFACANKPFIFDHSATDSEGDSLVYTICDPLEGARSTGNYDCVPQPCGVRPQPPFNPPYQPVHWRMPNYGLANAFGGVPLTVNPNTGMLNAVPNTVGQFVYGVCVKEYRDGVFISESRRDYQLNILVCQSVIKAKLDTTISCGSNTVQFSNQSSGATSYHWNFGDPTTQADTSLLANPVYVYPDTGAYHLQLIAIGPNKDCADTTNTLVRVLPAIQTSFVSNILPCSYQSTFLSSITSNVSGIPKYWNWSFGDGSSSAGKNPIHQFPGTGPYQVQLITKTNLGCVDTVIHPISFLPLPSVNAGPDFLLCRGDSSQLGNTSNPTYLYQWTPPKGLSIDSISFPYAHPDSTQLYTLTVTDTNGCKASDAAWVDIAFSTLSIQDTLQICRGSSIGLNPTGKKTYLYQWSPSVGLNSDTASNPIASPLQSTLYTAHIKTKTTSGDTCFIIKSVQVQVSQDTLQLVAPHDTSVCKNALLMAAGIGNNIHFIWSSNHFFTDTLNSSGIASIAVSPLKSPTTYFIKISNAFCSAIDSVKVFTHPASIISDPDQIICLGDSIKISAQNLHPSDVVSFSWSPLNEIISGMNTSSILVKPTANTAYQVIGMNQFTCRDSSVVQVVVQQPSLINVYADKDTIYEGESTPIHIQNAGAIQFTWSPSAGLSDIHSLNPIASPLVTTTYQVIATDANGCVIMTPITLYVKKVPLCGEPDIFVPNAFSPNGDLVNDKLYVRGNRIQELYFAVFDRWGEKVFETTSQTEGWDGNYKGEKAGPAVFVYYLKAKCKGGDEYFKKGNVTIIR